MYKHWIRKGMLVTHEFRRYVWSILNDEKNHIPDKTADYNTMQKFFMPYELTTHKREAIDRLCLALLFSLKCTFQDSDGNLFISIHGYHHYQPELCGLVIMENGIASTQLDLIHAFIKNKVSFKCTKPEIEDGWIIFWITELIIP